MQMDLGVLKLCAVKKGVFWHHVFDHRIDQRLVQKTLEVLSLLTAHCSMTHLKQQKSLGFF